MRVLVQHTLRTPRAPEELNVDDKTAGRRAWTQIPPLPVPRDDTPVPDAPGYIFSVNIQGLVYAGWDHYAVAPHDGGVRVWAWNDDLDDDGTDYRYGQVVDHYDGWVERTLTFGDGTWIRHQGPDQRMTWFAENLEDMARYVPRECGGLPVALRSWAEFPTPPSTLVRHGIWVRDVALFRSHHDAPRPGWREWMI